MVEDASLGLVFQALSDPTRQRIVSLLAEGGPRTVGEIAEPFEMSLQAVSKHIGVLTRSGVLGQHRRGRTRVCALNDEALSRAAGWLQDQRRFWIDRLESLGAYLDETRDEEDA